MQTTSAFTPQTRIPGQRMPGHQQRRIPAQKPQTTLWDRLVTFAEDFPPERPKLWGGPQYSDKLGAQPFKYFVKRLQREDNAKSGGVALTIVKTLGNEHDNMQHVAMQHSILLSGKGKQPKMMGMGQPALMYTGSLQLGGPEGSLAIEGVSFERYAVVLGTSYFNKKLKTKLIYRGEADAWGPDLKYKGDDYIINAALTNIQIEDLLKGQLDNIGYKVDYLQKVSKTTDLGVKVERNEKTRESQFLLSHVYQPKQTTRMVTELKRKTVASDEAVEYITRLGYGEQVTNSVNVETEFLYNWADKEYSFIYGITEKLANDMTLSVSGTEEMELRTSLQINALGDGAMFDLYGHYYPYSDDAFTVGLQIQSQL